MGRMGHAAAATVILLTAMAATALSAPTTRKSLVEPYYLNRCVQTDWQDDEAYASLMQATENEGRRHLYLASRVLSGASLLEGADRETVDRLQSRLRPALDEMQELAGDKAMLLPLATSVRAGSESERWFLAQEITSAAGDDQRAASLAVILLNDEYQSTRMLSAAGLSKSTVSATSRALVPFLAVHAFQDPQPICRYNASRAIGHLAGQDFESDEGRDATVAAAREWIRRHYDTSILGIEPEPADENADLKSLAEAYYLARCAVSGWHEEEPFGLLMESASDDGRSAHYLVSRVLACLAAAEEPPIIVDTNADGSRDAYLQAAEEAKARLGAMGKEAFLAWATVVRSGDENERALAAEELTRFIAREDAVNLLILLLNDVSPRVRGDAISFDFENGQLAQDVEAFLALRVVVEPDPQVRHSAAFSLSWLVGKGDLWFGDATDVFSMDEALVQQARDWIEQHYDTSILPPDDVAD